jgi:ABC-type multidrug transport system fused ATPase/permease subunit
LRNADKIVVIKDGVVIEKGPHQELIARNGVYAGLHRLQFGNH